MAAMHSPSIQIEKIPFEGDLLTPVGAYLKLRDEFPGCLLLESTDYRPGENPYTFICVNPLYGFKVTETEVIYNEGRKEVRELRGQGSEVLAQFKDFVTSFSVSGSDSEAGAGLYGYCSFDTVEIFDTLKLTAERAAPADIPVIHYQLFEYVLAFNHYRNETYLLHTIPEADLSVNRVSPRRLISLLHGALAPSLPFRRKGEAVEEITSKDHEAIISKCKQHIYRGDVFQIVPSRRFSQQYEGDDFAVYRALRVINPSPYLFYFDFGSFRVFGSSPEAQLLTDGKEARVYPIAGTFPRGTSEEQERQIVERLLSDEKENAEHVMLVDLARNDLSTHCRDVTVKRFKEVHRYSHVFHLVSEVCGNMRSEQDVVDLLAATFPAGTLSGAPKYRAIELIDSMEKKRRGLYGGAIGFFGFKGQSVHAIVIRSFVSKDFTLYRQAGGGIVSGSNVESEVNEVYHKLAALERALEKAEVR